MKRMVLIAGVLGLYLGWIALAVADEIDLKAFEKSVDNALKAYNDDDYKKFWADFSKMADALKTKKTFEALYTNGYKKLYGNHVKRGDMIKEKSSLDGDIGLVRYWAEFEKDKKLEIDINWVKEDKTVKFIQIQINKPAE
jgi:hypothetical protein